MKTVDETEKLQAAIALLEEIKKEEEEQLKVQFNIVAENFKPLNLVKSTIDEIIHQPNLKEDSLDTIVALITGYFSKKIFIGSTHNPFKQIFGNIMQMGITSVISKNAEAIRGFLSSFIKELWPSKSKAQS
tara:strand:- start:126252 stop:126644 length:393 start_codon:yes stop_codon:yes gene_type:complete